MFPALVAVAFVADVPALAIAAFALQFLGDVPRILCQKQHVVTLIQPIALRDRDSRQSLIFRMWRHCSATLPPNQRTAP